MKSPGLTLASAQQVAAALEPIVIADTARSFRSGKAVTAQARELLTQELDVLTAELAQFAAPLAQFAGEKLSLRAALRIDGGIMVCNLLSARDHLALFKRSVERFLLPAVSRATTDPVAASAVGAAFVGFTAGLEHALDTVATVAQETATSVERIVDILHHRSDFATAETLHAQSLSKLGPALESIDIAIESLAALKRSLG